MGPVGSTGEMSEHHVVPEHLMDDTKIFALFILLLFLCVIAMAANGFITVALSTKWLLRRTLSPHNKLLFSLSVTRLCLQWVVIGKNIYVFLYPTGFPYNPEMQLLNLLWDFFNAIIIWFCTWLGFYYSVKIATFTHPIFLWLKYKVSGWVSWMLAISIGLSTVNSALCFTGNQILYQEHLRSGGPLWNATWNGLRNSLEKFYFLSIKMIMWAVPTIIFLAFMFSLLFSMGRHMKKMLFTYSRLQDPRAQAHVKALLTLLSFFILFISCFLTLALSSASHMPFQEFKYWMWQVVIHLCTVLHPIILLSSNPKLREVLKKSCC